MPPYSRKRTRAQAFADETEDLSVGDIQTHMETIDVRASSLDDPAKMDEATLEKAQEIWVAFKEEYYETVEQFPLSLQRSFELMKELEGQVQAYNSELLSSLKFYIHLRQSIAPPPPPPPPHAEQDSQTRSGHNDKSQTDGEPNTNSELKPNGVHRLNSEVTGKATGGMLTGGDNKPPSEDNEPKLEGGEPTLADDNAKLLSNQEHKLENDITQEVASPSVGRVIPPHSTPGPTSTQRSSPHKPTPVLLRTNSFTFSPIFNRPATPTSLSIPEERRLPPRSSHALLAHVAWLADEAVHVASEKVNLAQAAIDSTDRHIRLLDQAIKEQETAMAVGLRPGTHPTSLVLPEVVGPATRHGRSGGARANDALGPAIAAAEQQAHATRGAARQGVSLKITLPPSLPSPTHVSEDAEIYCSCRRPSFGEMIACEDEDCPNEWYHLECLGMTSIPEGDWFCDICLKRQAAQGNLAKKKKATKRRR